MLGGSIDSKLNENASVQSVVNIAMLVASLMLAQQVAGKAARDALFLSQFGPSRLPLMVIAAAASSILGGLISSRILQAASPARMVPWAFLGSGILHLIEWVLIHGPYRPVVIVAVYIHIVALGAIVLSSFWSLLNEHFDPRSGKQNFGRIAGVGTLGGIAGGFMTERFAVILPPTSILLFLGGLHILCGLVSFLLVNRSRRMSAVQHSEHDDDERISAAAWPLFQRSRYAQILAALVMLGTTTAAVLDIAFKTQAATLVSRGPGLLRFFAIFYTATQMLSFLVQVLVTGKWLERLGLARGVGSLPAVVGAGSIAALIVPSFAVLIGTRALEIILRGSIYRAGYELLYTPMPVQEKRAAKPVVDVVFDRLGDAIGGAISQILVALSGAYVVQGVLAVAAILSGLALVVVKKLEQVYVRVLEKGLVERALELDVSTTQDLTTRSVLLRTLSLEPTPLASPLASAVTESHAQDTRPPDPTLQRLIDLQSGKTQVVARALTGIDQLDRMLAPQVITLLGWDAMAPEALRVLRSGVHQITGQLLDTLLDESSDFAVRRRIPRVLAYSDDLRAVQGLLLALNDSRFEVRFQCARSLDVILQRNPQHRPSRETVFAIIERELSVSRGVWESRRLLDGRQSNDQFLFLDNVLRERANLSWEHLFSLLALILPREPLKVAFQALHTDDRLLRGLALEYLDSVLPPSLRRLQNILETTEAASVRRVPRTDVTERLLEAQKMVTLKLAGPEESPGARIDK